LRAKDNLLCELCFCMEPDAVLLMEPPSELLVDCCSEGCLTRSGGCSVAATFRALTALVCSSTQLRAVATEKVELYYTTT
jgi:hypothetical protein